MSIVLERHDDLSALREEWQLLGGLSQNPFLSWEWASLWWEHYGRGRRLALGLARHRDGRPRCIVPLFLSTRRPLRVLRLVGHTTGDVLAPVCARGDEAFASAALRRMLAAERGWDVFLGEHLQAEHAWAQPGSQLLASEPCPEVHNPGDWSSYLRTRTRHLRQSVGSMRRRLEAGHRVVYRLSTGATLENDLAVLFRLHDARWADRSTFSTARRFHEAFARTAVDRGWLRLWVLEVDDQPAAAMHVLRYGGDEWFYQSGRDPALDPLSAGTVLFTHSLATALDEGVAVYHLLRGGEAYKLRFATATPQLATVAVGRGLAGRSALGVAGLAGPSAARAAAGLAGLR
jgi:CelD/BcsL family acetyltransferase involved in cellulose biosynthesis